MTNITYQDDAGKKGKSVMSIDVNQEHLSGEDGWWDGYYSEDNIDDDHLKQSVDTMFKETQSRLESWLGNNQCIILMHDRQFRTNPDGSNPYIEKLSDFIQKCKAAGYVFDVLENHQNFTSASKNLRKQITTYYLLVIPISFGFLRHNRY